MKKFFITPFLSLLTGSYRLAKVMLSLIVGIVLISTAAVVFLYVTFARNLPDIKSLADYHPPVMSEVFASDGTKIGEFWTECRIFVPFEKIPKRLVQAFIDSEDDRFFEHQGVDMRAIARAFFANLRAHSVTQGGSTITQQVTRSLLLTRERSLARKVREAILATRLERFLSKEHILTIYLNQIYLGNRAYGVAAAARNYFHKSLDDLTLAEQAILAGLPTAPTSFSPIVSPEGARHRQEHVLSRMWELGHITKAEMEAALAESFTIFVAGVDKEWGDTDAAYFVEYVRQAVKERYGDDALYRHGLKIFTTADATLQHAALGAVRRGTENLDHRQGFRGPIGHVDESAIPERAQQIAAKLAEQQWSGIIPWPPARSPDQKTIRLETGELYDAIVTALDGNTVKIQIGPVSGVILHDGYKWARHFNTKATGYDGADYVGNPSNILKVGDIIKVKKRADEAFDLAQEPLVQGALFAVDPHTGFIRAIVGGTDYRKSEFNRATQALRQPGSSFKPFVYAAALDKGYLFDTTIIDAPVTYQVGIDTYWSPKNYGNEYKGPTTFQNAITFSRNVPTVKILFDIGTHYLAAYARKMGITSPLDKYLSLGLGANGVYLSDMVRAYSVFLNHGVLRPTQAILKIEEPGKGMLEELVTPTDVPTPPATIPPETPAATAPETASDTLKQAIKRIEASDLNTELFAREQKTIEQDKLILTDLEIKTLYGSSIPPGHVITPQTAHLMVELLRGVVERGTGTKVHELGKPAAGKTGTTNDETDAWFIGFVPDLVAGVWIGFDEIKPIGKGETGGHTAAPVFLDFMKAATAGHEAKDFERPDNFPTGNIARLTGGSALFGNMPRLGLAGEEGGADRAGTFFEEDWAKVLATSPTPATPPSSAPPPTPAIPSRGENSGF